MPKNLILIHLESISNTILWQYRSELKTIWKIMQHSYRYNHFYTSATSTEMSVLHIRSGTSDAFDGVSLWGQKSDFSHPDFRRSQANHIFQELFHAGYGRSERIYCAVEFQIHKLAQHYPTILGPDHKNVLPMMQAALAQAHNDNIPFCFWYMPGITHITCEDDRKNSTSSFTERFRMAYRQLDEQVSNVLQLLTQYKLMDKSVIVFYGDHGDELWSHGLNGGWCHVTTPYASLCWTPLFIYDRDCPAGETDQLASAIDLKKTLIKRLIPDFAPTASELNESMRNHRGFASPLEKAWFYKPSRTLPSVEDYPFSGIDLAQENREYAFSQSLFALQLEYNDQAKALLKGYAVTDGVYRLCVTSGGNEPRNGGLEFFCDDLDPGNNRNLLNFFELDGNGDIIDLKPPSEVFAREFSLIFNPDAVEEIKRIFQDMKKALYAYIREKEEHAKKYSVGTIHTLSDYAFRHSRRRPYVD